MKFRLPVAVACMIAKAVSALTIVNHTPAEIHVSVSVNDELWGGAISFYDILPGDSESWGRSHWQIATILRDDTGATEVMVVKPTETYDIGSGNTEALFLQQ
ncbi:hypothetical protein DFQ26_007210 [Actinomortierella ambigua]|nr:hypothetical protein DFQ26_007210 [Actinomortierella ambigua]